MGRKLSLSKVVRPNILTLQPYRCARDDYSIGILLDANENAYGSSLSSNATKDKNLDLHRYPSPLNMDLKDRIGQLRGVDKEKVFLGVGSDEIIDLLIRVTCKPEKEGILVCPPTYGMYKVSAKVNDVQVHEVPLKEDFSLDVEAVNAYLTAHPNVKLVLLTSPGNPTGTLISLSSIRQILTNEKWNGLVVVDEAYIDFSLYGSEIKEAISGIELLNEGFENVVVMQTLSKGFGLAGIRLGISFQSLALTDILNAIKAPYSISTPTVDLALDAFSPPSLASAQSKIKSLISNRAFLISSFLSPRLQELGIGRVIGGNHANFILVQILDKEKRVPDNGRAEALYKYLAENEDEEVKSEGERVVVRFRGKERGCEGCLRVTVGTEDECKTLLKRFEKTLKQVV